MAEAREHEAVANARHRLELQRQSLGENHPDFATGLNQLALLLIMHGNPESAEPLLRQALAIRKDALGENHPDYATNLSSLAGLLWARGDLDGAEPLLRQALEIRWDVLGSGHPKSIASLNSLEQLLRAKQDWAGVERLSSRDMSPVPKVAGPEVGARSSPVMPPAAPVQEPFVPPPVVAPPAATIAPAPAAHVASPVPAPPSVPPPAVTATAPIAPVPVLEPAPRTPSPEPAEAPSVPVPPVAPPEVRPAVVSSSRASVIDGPSRLELVERHESLSREFFRVGERLEKEAEQWKAGGAPPSQGLIDELSACGREFATLRESVQGLADALGTGTQGRRLANLQEVGDLLNDLGEAEGRKEQLEALRGQALTLLDRVLTLAASDGKPLAPLEECQKKAREQRAAIADAPALELPADATRLAEGDHPFHALLTLVEGDGLSDDIWASSLETVEKEFGKPLSVAVARSKIISPGGA